MWYILKRGKPIKAKNIKAYLYWARYNPFTVISQSCIKNTRVSTVFLGLDHGFGSEYPVLWETMIFGGAQDQYQERYISVEAARIGHNKAVKVATLTTAEYEWHEGYYDDNNDWVDGHFE